MALQIGRSRLPELMGDMSQSELARRLGTSSSFISQVISGKKYFSFEMGKNVADILGVNMESLHEWIPIRKDKRLE